jgi:hypothetical protein
MTLLSTYLPNRANAGVLGIECRYEWNCRHSVSERILHEVAAYRFRQSEPRTELVQVRVSPEEHEAMRARAQAEGITSPPGSEREC